jgi:hypothetical protein
MPSNNKRIYFAVKYLAAALDGTNTFTPIHGVQTGGLNTNFNIDAAFEWGQISPYEIIEGIPDVTITAQKVLDGYPLIYHHLTRGASSATLAGRSRTKNTLGVAYFDDTQDSASGVPIKEVIMSGLFTTNFSYNFQANGRCTEDVSAIGSTKLIRDTSVSGTLPLISGAFNNTDTPLAATGSGGVQLGHRLVWIAAGLPTTRDVNGAVSTSLITILPPDVDGISTSGTNDLTGGDYGAHVQTIAVSVDLNREAIYELGRKVPYHRFVNFPVTVNCSIGTIAKTGDTFGCTEEGTQGDGNNLINRTIKIKMKEGLFIDLGIKNKLVSTEIGGGDTGGGNDVLTLNYQNFNDCAVYHPQDPTTALRN